MSIDISLTEAEQNELAVIDLCRNIHYNFLELGGLLLENYERGYWTANRHESFQEFIEMLGIGYSWATRMMGLSKIVATQLLTEGEMLEIGVAKACLLLPLVKRGKLDDDIKELAKNAPYHDLRKELGYKVKDELPEEYLLCPRCGADITFHKGMIRKR